MTPTASVIVPTYYRNDALEDALESVHQQTLPQSEIEIIVVDGSEDDQNGRSIAEQYGADYYCPTDDPGLAGCRDIGIEAAMGDYIRLLDDDDMLIEDAIESQIDLSKSKDCGVVYGGIEWENGHQVLPDTAIKGDVLRYALSFQMAPCIPSTLLVERSCFEEMPLLESLPSDDHGMMIELAKVADFDFIADVVIKRGGGDEGLGSASRTVKNRLSTIESYESLYEEYPETKRKALGYTNLLAAQSELNDEKWSKSAIFDAWRAFYYYPTLETGGFALASIGGRPLRDFARRVYMSFQSDNHRGKIA
ncbi:glycosyltransferase family 2 protein [Halorientalis halophila]|uniref:glycosyltransferase family 2 protein n=1 Tax=Halorientalis halophila TaxID=3108499 RepID=UPI003007FD62